MGAGPGWVFRAEIRNFHRVPRFLVAGNGEACRTCAFGSIVKGKVASRTEWPGGEQAQMAKREGSTGFGSAPGDVARNNSLSPTQPFAGRSTSDTRTSVTSRPTLLRNSLCHGQPFVLRPGVARGTVEGA